MKHTKRRQGKEASLKTPTLLGLLTFGIAASAVALSLQVHAQSPGKPKNVSAIQTATGQYITPTAVPGAVQQFLNPELPAYPRLRCR